ncbi:hypothetical protein [uncultured Bacteroides sp.]|uniref:hypothetical protein n=1 Tax=uncultured Bacteroides sp. TaxID=162156 RepID=UPI002AAC0954|nr:hypothetical protein [uncultured Bacteroides sp.]
MNKYKFKPYVWMIFDYKGASAIGRTIYGQSKEELIAFVSETGKQDCIPYSEIERPRILSILSKKEHEKDSSHYFMNGTEGGEA